MIESVLYGCFHGLEGLVYNNADLSKYHPFSVSNKTHLELVKNKQNLDIRFLFLLSSLSQCWVVDFWDSKNINKVVKCGRQT